MQNDLITPFSLRYPDTKARVQEFMRLKALPQLQLSWRAFKCADRKLRTALLADFDYALCEVDGVCISVDVQMLAKRYAQSRGHSGAAGGWIYSKSGTPLCQGWGKYRARYWSQIKEWALTVG